MFTPSHPVPCQEQPRADATGSMRSAISADAEMPAPKIQISSPKDRQMKIHRDFYAAW